MVKKSKNFRDVKTICSYEAPSGMQVDVNKDELIEDLKAIDCEIIEVKIFRDEKHRDDKLRLVLKAVKLRRQKGDREIDYGIDRGYLETEQSQKPMKRGENNCLKR